MSQISRIAAGAGPGRQAGWAPARWLTGRRASDLDTVLAFGQDLGQDLASLPGDVAVRPQEEAEQVASAHDPGQLAVHIDYGQPADVIGVCMSRAARATGVSGRTVMAGEVMSSPAVRARWPVRHAVPAKEGPSGPAL